MPDAKLKAVNPAEPPRPDHIRHEWSLVTPEIARQYLETMHANRSQSKLEKGVLAGNLEEGNWFGAISVVFFDDGTPMRAWDGQHRFEAVIAAGLPAWMQFVIGVTEQEASYIDTGRPRSRSDWYKMTGVVDSNRRAVLSRALGLYYKYGIEGTRQPGSLVLTPAEQDKWATAPGMAESVRAGNALRAAIGVNHGYAAYAVFLTAARDADGNVTELDPDGFWESVRSGVGLQDGDPALTLRNFLSRNSTAGRLPADERLMQHYLLATAWNKHVLGQRWSKPAPKFETKGTTGKKIFPASQVPDFLPIGTGRLRIGALREAFGVVKGS
ncbi:MAG TPA: hypothetical protein VGG75_13905 [Trebonia sp.]